MRRYALKEFVRNIKFNVFIIIQLAFVFVMIVFALSSILQNLKYYTPIKNYLGKDGAYIFVDNPTVDTTKDKKALSNYSKYFDDALYSKEIPIEAELTESELAKAAIEGVTKENPYDANVYGYYDNVTNLYTPTMIDGEWLSKIDNYNDEENVLHAVITENYYGLKVGDIYTQSLLISGSGYKNFKIKIIGVMKNGTRSFGMIREYDSSIKLTAKDMFESYDVNQKGIPLVLLSMNELDKYNCVGWLTGTGMMIRFKDGLSSEEYTEALNATYEIGSSTEFKEIRENSLKEIKNQMTVLAPIIGGIILLVIVSVLSMSAVNTNKQLRNYGIYYLCGCKWRQCAMINTLSIFISEAAAAILAFLALRIAQLTGLLNNTVVAFGKWQLIGCLCIAVITLIVALIMPALIIGKSTPREIIKASR